jgi:hypothetical protein
MVDIGNIHQMVLTNRKGDLILKKKRGLKPKVLTSIRQHTNPFFTGTPSVPRPAPIAVTEAMKINDSGKNKAQVVPSTNTKKKNKAAIIGGSVAGALGAWGLGSTVANYVQQRKQTKLNDSYDQQMADRYKEIEPFIRKSNWETDLKNFYGPSFHEGEPELSFGSDVARNVESQIGTAVEGAV